VKTYFLEYAKDRGLYKEKVQGSLEKLPHEGVSSNLGRRSKIGRLGFISIATVLIPVAPLKSDRRPPSPPRATSPGKPVSPFSDHYLTRHQLKSKEKLPPNLST
jgi:hypothetical protein